MSKPKTETETAVVEEKTGTTKRDVTAAVVSAAVIVVLGVASNLLAAAIGSRVNDAISRKTEKTEDE